METAHHQRTSQELEIDRINHSVSLLRDARDTAPQLAGELYGQAKDLETTLFAEHLSGQNRTDFSFEIKDGELFVLQPSGVVDWLAMHRNGLERAEAKARENSRLSFYAEIAAAELNEASIQQAIARSGEPQTLFSISLSGDDIAGPSDLLGVGRDPDSRRGYMRASVFGGGKLHLYSCSMDGLTVADARDIYKDFFGVELDPGMNSLDILRSPIRLAGAYPGLLDKIAPKVGHETHQFVRSQADLIDAHMQGLDGLALHGLTADELAKRVEELRYDISSSLKQRFEGTWIDTGNLAESVAYAGEVEREAGTEYFGCDNIISVNQNNIVQAGYVNALSLLRENWTWRDGICQIKECPSRQPKTQKVKVGPCSVCRGCQDLFDKNKDPAREYRQRSKKQSKSWAWWA